MQGWDLNFKVKKFPELSPKSKKYGTLILDLTMENSKKFTSCRSDKTSQSYTSLKMQPQIEVWKNEKIDFFDIERHHTPTFSTR